MSILLMYTVLMIVGMDVGMDRYGFSIDTLNVVVRFNERVATVVQVQHLELCDRSHCAGKAF